jgi:hypothetical protein
MHPISSTSGGIMAGTTTRQAESADFFDAKKSMPRSTPAGNEGTLFQQEELRVKRRERRPLGQHERVPIDPRVRSWVDNVIVPALLDRWVSENGSGAAA